MVITLKFQPPWRPQSLKIVSHTSQQYHRVLFGIALLHRSLETDCRQRATATTELTSSDSLGIRLLDCQLSSM